MQKKNILITGVSSGIGLACASYFIEQKTYHVYGSIRKETDAIRIKKALGDNFFPVLMDVSNIKSVQHAFEKLKIQCKDGLSLLINNAGIGVAGPIKDIDIDDFIQQMDVNVNGVVRVTNVFLPLLGASLTTTFPAGQIINISSVSGLFNTPFLGPYCVSKHALESLSDIYRRELSLYDIKVTVVEPGPTKSEIWSKMLTAQEKHMDSDYRRIWKNMSKRVAAFEANAINAEVLAKKIHQIFLLKKPAPRYIVTKGKFKTWFSSYVLPNRLVDFIVKRMLKKLLIK